MAAQVLNGSVGRDTNNVRERVAVLLIRRNTVPQTTYAN